VPGRRLAAGAGLATLALIALGPAAVADVNISPAQAGQGSAAALTLQVRNDRPGVFTTKVEVQFPQADPIAEIYPMSVPNWAPIATSRNVDKPLQGIHNSGLTVVTSAITWTRATDAPKAPAVENLSVELGPLPDSSQLVLTVLQTYSDGKVVRWSGPSATGTGTVVRLQPVAAAAAPAAGDEAAAPEAAAPSGNTGVQLGLIGAGIIGGVLISALAVVTIGSRYRTQRPAEDTDVADDPAEPKNVEPKDDEPKDDEPKDDEPKDDGPTDVRAKDAETDAAAKANVGA
jgi:uncharacterized protein YcnI